MRIVYDPAFLSNIQKIWNYIAEDSPKRADRFLSDLRVRLESLPSFPYRCRKSIWFEEEKIRDLIFKGYTVPYLIESDQIVILDIFKWEK